jgi:ribosomal protein L32
MAGVLSAYEPQRRTHFDADTSSALRADVAQGNYTLPNVEAMYGVAIVITYRGPGAVCPDCGSKVTSGDPALHFNYDFVGYGRYTLTPVYVHLEPCRMERGITARQANK